MGPLHRLAAMVVVVVEAVAVMEVEAAGMAAVAVMEVEAGVMAAVAVGVVEGAEAGGVLPTHGALARLGGGAEATPPAHIGTRGLMTGTVGAVSFGAVSSLSLTTITLGRIWLTVKVIGRDSMITQGVRISVISSM